MNKVLTAMILAAGRGERMRPLTDHLPKPLLEVASKALLQWHLEAMSNAGIDNVVINTAWLGEKIEEKFGNLFVSSQGQPLSIEYSHEGLDFSHALETAGGIVRALPRLVHPSRPQHGIFWAVAGDAFAPDFVFNPQMVEQFAATPYLAHLWLVPNPAHHAAGDFLLEDGLAKLVRAPLEATAAPQSYTFSGIGLYRSTLFQAPWCTIAAGNPHGETLALSHILRQAIAQNLISAELYQGKWLDVGTVERLQEANQWARLSKK